MRCETDVALVELLFPTGDVSQTQALVEASNALQVDEWAWVGAEGSGRYGKDFQSRALETFEDLQSEPSAVLYRHLSSPILRGWLAWTCALFQRGPSAESALRLHMNLWNNVRYSFGFGEFHATMSVLESLCFSWDPRLAFTIPGHQYVDVERKANTVTISSAHNPGEIIWRGRIEGPSQIECIFAKPGIRVVDAPLLPSSDIAIRNDLPTLKLALSGTKERDTGVVLGSYESSPAVYPALSAVPYQDAARLLSAAWAEEYADWNLALQVVVPRTATGDRLARGMTVSSHQGAVWIMADGLLPVFESMVHEFSHIKLRYIEDTYPLLTERQTPERFIVGWRSDPRPVEGIYEGIYVSVHIIRAIRRVLDGALPGSEDADLWAERATTLQHQVLEAHSILKAHASLTEHGLVFADWAAEAASA